ncbi:MAG: ribonuclease J [Deltaproteobacteria bacterium]|nr:ribonuclease J [Deltaproteobacteria bacterium]
MPLSQAPAKKALRIIPLGGLGEIGLNCMVFEYADELIVVDCGVMFSDLQMLGVDFVIPDMTYLRENKDRIAGYVITHGHEDHIGALPFAMKAHPAPIYSTRFAHKLIEAKLAEHGLDRKTEFRVFAPGDTIRFRHFSVTPVPVNHSIVESMALFIDTPLGKVVFTGDFKMDASPHYGNPMDPKPFQKAGNDGVLLLMSDSTNVERDGHSLSEKRIYHKFEQLFTETQGLTVIAVFASNVGRIGQVVEIARKLGRKVAFMGRSMEQNARLARELGYLDGLEEVLIGVDDIEKHGRDRCIVLSTGSQGEYRSGLMRVANNEHRAVKIREGDLVVMSSKFIPGNEKAIGRMINDLFRLGAEVLYEPLADIHVSGHANAGELRAMLKMTKPRFFVPVHGEYRHLVHHKKLALGANVAKGNAVIAANGDILETDGKSMAIVGHMEENRVLIEGEGGKDVSKVILKDRRKVAETGIVFSVLIRNRVSGKVMAGPDIISRGLLEETLMGDLFDKAKETVMAILDDCDAIAREREVNVQEEIRVGLRRFFQARIGKKPVVVPVLIDV